MKRGNKKNDKINILMCGSKLSVKGGMVSVINNYLNYKNWENYNIIYVPTHIERNKMVLALYFILACIKIFVILITKKIKIAHLHVAEKGSFYRKAILVKILKKFRVKVILHHHAAEFEKFYNNLTRRGKRYVNNIIDLADINIVLSKKLISMITDKAPKANVSVLYNAVQTYSLNQYNENANGILFLGRMGKRKGIYDLLNVISEIDEEIPSNIKFYLCGDGEIESIRQKILNMRISHRIAYIGWINDIDKINIFNNICINVLPSYNEGLPMSILETMAYGIPNISTKIASIPEVIKENENGCLVTPGDINELRNNLKLLIFDKELRKKYSINSYRTIMKNFSLDNHIILLKNFYRELAD